MSQAVLRTVGIFISSYALVIALWLLCGRDAKQVEPRSTSQRSAP